MLPIVLMVVRTNPFGSVVCVKHGPLAYLTVITHTIQSSGPLFSPLGLLSSQLGVFVQTSKASSQRLARFGATYSKGTIDTGKGRLQESLADLDR